jgi:probable phosphoglycerate mutase
LDWVRTHPAERILVCTHGRTLRGMVSLMKGATLADMEGIQHANTGCYVVEYTGGRFHFQLENDTSHLP